MTGNGGTNASYGFRRQFLVTAEAVLRTLLDDNVDPSTVAVVVEPTFLDLGGADAVDDDIVDFAIETDGVIVRRVQVKSTRIPSGMNPLRYSDATAIFGRMGTNAREIVILTNKPPAKKLLQACAPPRVDAYTGNALYTAIAHGLTAGHTTPERFIAHDRRTADQLKASVLALVRQIRRNRASGLGEQSAAMLTSMLLDRLFESAADLNPRRWTGMQVLELLCTPENQIAHARGEYDWGVPLVEVPRLLSAVTRTPTLSSLTSLFTDSATVRTPTVAVLAGTTGFGKSTIAADFCHLNRHLYEHVYWVDARTPELLKAWATDRVAQMGVDITHCPDIGAALRTELARLGGPWVVVFDGAVRRRDIEPYLPTSGTGFVIITTTNSTGWWHTAHELPVSSFTNAEAVACFHAYARIEPGTHTEVIADIVTRLGRVPLAIAMAASYFRNAGDDIAALSGHYFDSLAALDDDASIPDDFDRTAFAAIRFAVDQLADESSPNAELARESQMLLYHSAFFAPELIPVNLVLQTVHGSVIELDLASPPRPSEADQDVRNRILTKLRTQTIARRRRYLGGSPV